MFLHAGWFHLIGNMFFLWAFAISLELSLGTARFLALYFVWGLAGGLLHLFTNLGSPVPMVGASGAIAGLMGAYWMTFGAFTKIRTWVFLLVCHFKVNIPASVFAVVWLLLQFHGIALASEHDHGHGGVAFFAHLGGFTAGALTMLVLKNRTKAQLVVDRYGALKLEETLDPSAVEARQAEPAAPARPETCPYCHAPLDDADHLAPTLLRCPNPDCRRCIYLETSMATSRA
jgi:membrane associated rhomboid family serine protease